MQSSLKPIAVGACVSALAGAFLIGPAAAAQPTLVLSIRDSDSLLLPNARTLGCDDYPGAATGSHPNREDACASLETAGGDFANLRSVSTNCPMIYAPVTATARGRHKGTVIDFETTYPNSCVAAAESDNVFAW